MLTIRQEHKNIRGRIRTIIPPDELANPLNRTWTFRLEPEDITVLGANNVDRLLDCRVNIDFALSKTVLIHRLSLALAYPVQVIGTLCDDAVNGITIICPLQAIIIDLGFEHYELNEWPISVSDTSLFVFGHAATSTSDPTEHHLGQSQTFNLRLDMPKPPTTAAVPFWRAYSTTEIGRIETVYFQLQSASLTNSNWLEVQITTGVPSTTQGFWGIQIGMTYEEPDLHNYCPPGHCDEADGTYCVNIGETRYAWKPAFVPEAQKGYLVISPGNGEGTIGTILASLAPPQFYDHMGIFVDHGHTIRHCTSSIKRYQQEDFYTELPLPPPLPSIKAPLLGFRPDLIQYGWPGTITQHVSEVYHTGYNTKNTRWNYQTKHPGADQHDPDNPGLPFALYHLPRADRKARLSFHDPEIDWSETMTRLQDKEETVAGNVYPPVLVQPPFALKPQVTKALEAVAEAAKKIEAHYRFFAYSKGDISMDSAFEAPDSNNIFWTRLPDGANWSAGTIPAVCSTFIWAAVQQANLNNPAHKILLEDKATPEDPPTGLEYGTNNGLYQYHEDERRNAAKKLVGKLREDILSRYKAELRKIPQLLQGGIDLTPLRNLVDQTARNVSNQTTNAFAADACDKLDDAWLSPGAGESVSPDNILNFWDPKTGGANSHEQGQTIYGSSREFKVKHGKWEHIPLRRKQTTDPGRGTVFYNVWHNGRRMAGVTIRFDNGCQVVLTTKNLEPRDSTILLAGTHIAEAFFTMLNPVTGQQETYQTTKPLKFEVLQNEIVTIDLQLAPPPDLFRLLEIELSGVISDRAFFGGNADSRPVSEKWQLHLQLDPDDDPSAPPNQRNTVLHLEHKYHSDAVGSGVRLYLTVRADLDPGNRDITCYCELSLVDEKDGGFFGIGESVTIDQTERKWITLGPEKSEEVWKNLQLSSHEAVPERADVTLKITNRHQRV